VLELFYGSPETVRKSAEEILPESSSISAMDLAPGGRQFHRVKRRQTLLLPLKDDLVSCFLDKTFYLNGGATTVPARDW
jgi:hypothetical protein